MRIALSSYSGYGAWFAAMLRMDGHKVDYHVSEPKFASVLGGIAPRPLVKEHDGRQSDGNIGYPAYDRYDLSVFDLTGRDRQAVYSSVRVPTIGDGYSNKLLEEDRLFGIQLMEDAGIDVPPYETFTDASTAKAFIQETGKRYVYKPNGGQDQDTSTTYVSKSSTDMLEYIDKLFLLSKGSPFLLQEFKPGIEVSVEGWFNGTDFYCLNCTLEEKKFMNDGVGPNTGCAGNLVFTLSAESKVFKEGLGRARDVLQQYGYRGMVDLNTIATEDKLYGLEWTPRFGYDASATLYNMYGGDFGELLFRTATGGIPEQKWKAEFGATSRLTIPPYPTEIRIAKLKGIPIKGLDTKDDDALRSTYLYDVCCEGEDLVCAGTNGFIAVPIATANSAPMAFDRLEAKVKSITIPDMQHRTDLKSTIQKRYYELQRMGWI
ncbi:MAG TPA: ATP-grasp domain-containing protein [Candidatus Saccharimonadales bacterium]|jgi:phosphoribosylamine-glycine ligase